MSGWLEMKFAAEDVIDVFFPKVERQQGGPGGHI
jgi:hypothetical protein